MFKDTMPKPNNLYAYLRAFYNELLERGQQAYSKDKLESEVKAFRTVCTKLKRGLYETEGPGKAPLSIHQKYFLLVQELGSKAELYNEVKDTLHQLGDTVEGLQRQYGKDVERKTLQRQIYRLHQQHDQLEDQATELSVEVGVNLFPLKKRYEFCFQTGQLMYQELLQNCLAGEQLLVRAAKEGGKYGWINEQTEREIKAMGERLQTVREGYFTLFHELQGRSRKPLEDIILATMQHYQEPPPENFELFPSRDLSSPSLPPPPTEPLKN